MQLKNFHSPLDIGTWPASLTLRKHNYPPVADLSTPQASNRRVTMTTSTTATEPLFEVLAEGKNEISVELCVFGTG
jgi:hypothetical protein